MGLSFIWSSSLYVISTVHDREMKLRYLLNFAGMQSTPYFLGIFLAELLIFLIPILLLLLLGAIFQVSIIANLAVPMFLSFLFFAFSFLQLNYLIGFMFSTVEVAFKRQPLMLILLASIYGIILSIGGLFHIRMSNAFVEGLATFFMYVNPFYTLFSAIFRLIFIQTCLDSTYYVDHPGITKEDYCNNSFERDTTAILDYTTCILTFLG